MKFTDLVDPSLVIIKMPLSIEEYFFLEIHQLYTFYPKIPPLGVKGGYEV